jgi:hypothetical protein
MPNPNQRVIQIDDGNKAQPQIQPVNPHDIEPVMKSMRAEPSTPSPNMDLFASFVRNREDDIFPSPIGFNSPSVLMRTPQFNYNKGDKMVPKSATINFDDTILSAYDPIPPLEAFGSYEDEPSVASSSRRRGGRC